MRQSREDELLEQLKELEIDRDYWKNLASGQKVLLARLDKKYQTVRRQLSKQKPNPAISGRK